MTLDEIRRKVNATPHFDFTCREIKYSTAFVPFEDNTHTFLGRESITTNALGATNNSVAKAMCKDAI